MTTLKRFIKDDSGATMVEYGLIVALVAAVCMATVSSIGQNLLTMFKSVNTQLAPGG